MVGEELIEGVETVASMYMKVRRIFEIIFGSVLVVLAAILLFFKVYAIALIVLIVGVASLLMGFFSRRSRLIKTRYGKFVVADPTQTTIEEQNRLYPTGAYPNHP